MYAFAGLTVFMHLRRVCRTSIQRTQDWKSEIFLPITYWCLYTLKHDCPIKLCELFCKDDSSEETKFMKSLLTQTENNAKKHVASWNVVLTLWLTKTAFPQAEIRTVSCYTSRERQSIPAVLFIQSFPSPIQRGLQSIHQEKKEVLVDWSLH